MRQDKANPGETGKGFLYLPGHNLSPCPTFSELYLATKRALETPTASPLCKDPERVGGRGKHHLAVRIASLMYLLRPGPQVRAMLSWVMRSMGQRLGMLGSRPNDSTDSTLKRLCLPDPTRR